MGVAVSKPFRVQINAPTAPPPPPANDVWTDLGSSGDPGDGWYWQKQAARVDNGHIYIPSFGTTTKILNPATGVWTVVTPSKWIDTGTSNNTENFDVVHDAANHRYWVTGQAPSDLTGPVSSPTYGHPCYFADSDSGAQSLTIATGKLTGANSSCGIALGKLISLPLSGESQPIIVTDLTSFAASSYFATGSLPTHSLPVTGSLWMERRSGIDSRTGQGWAIDSDGELCVCNGIIAGAPVWSKIPTFGTKPTTAITNQAFVCELDEAKNTIVAWCPSTQWVTGFSETNVRTAWALDLGTLVWRQVGVTGGIPPGGVASYHALIYDHFAQCLYLCVSSAVSGNNGTNVWRLQLEGPQV